MCGRHKSPESGPRLDMLAKLATEPEPEPNSPRKVSYNADGQPFFDDGSGCILLTKAESDAAEQRIRETTINPEWSLSAWWKDSQGRALYRLHNELDNLEDVLTEDELDVVC